MRRLIVLAAMVSAPAWGSEPATIFGIALGSPLGLPECGTRIIAGRTVYESTHQTICSETARPDQTAADVSWSRINFPGDQAPLIAKWPYVNAYLYRGVVEGVEFPTAGISSQDVVLEQLRQKFGQPTSLRNVTVQNAMGAAFQSYDAEWQLPTLRVTFRGSVRSLDMGKVEMCTPVLCELRATSAASRANQRQGL
jgi:hypothetical protein